MKILVTGSNGLVGSALKEELGDSHLYHTRQICDLTDYKSTKEYFFDVIKNKNVDTVIHTAALVGGVLANSNNNFKFFEINNSINYNVIKVCYDLKIKNFINILSTCIFPNENITYPLTADQIDNGPPHPSNYGYSYAKRLSGYMTKIYGEMTKNNWYSVIPTNVYGPNDNFNLENSHLVPGLIHKAFLAKKNKTNFTIWGDGTPLRQFIYSKDLAKLIIDSINKWKSPEYNFLINKEEVTVYEIAKIILDEFGLDNSQIEFDKTKPNGQLKKPATSDVQNFNFTDIRIGIRETIKWFEDNYENCRK
jgi:GDP-L-fucose synthase